MANGILSKPPKSTHEQRAKYNAKHGAGAWAAKIGKAPGGGNSAPQGVLPQQEYGDEQLGGFANEQLPGIQQSFEQPFDWQKYQEMAPVTGDYNQWVDSQMQTYNKAFDERMNPQFAQQGETFEQTMANRGIPMGSELYNREKSRMEQGQNDARTQAYAANQGQAIQGAESLFNVGTAAQQNALGLGQAARYGSLNDYQALTGAQSGFQQQKALQDDNQQAQLQQLKFAAKNRGGGGAAPTAWQQAGFASYSDMAAFEDARRRGNSQFEWQNNPSYQQPKGPSTGSQVGGQILGVGLDLLSQYAGKNWF